MITRKVVLVYSGGLDSTTLLYELDLKGYKVYPLNFSYGSKHNERERVCAEKIANGLGLVLKKVDLPLGNLLQSNLLKTGGEIPEGHYADDNMKKTVVPFRNGIMLSIAAGYAESVGADAIFIASHAGDHYIYPDCRPGFNSAMRKAIEQGLDRQVDLLTPYAKMTKDEIVTLGDHYLAPLAETWSCYKGQDIHCGKCGACNERKEAFQLAKIVDNTNYME